MLPEKSFEIFWEFCSSSVAGVHRDENSHARNQTYVVAEEHKAFFFRF